MNTKAKGTNAERDLIHLFWESKWAAVRIAGSGSMKYPSPDVLASNKTRKVGIECKSTKNNSQYLTKEEIADLKKFCGLFGAEPWVGIKFKTNWYFLSLDDLKETQKNFVVNQDLAKQKGLTFNELVGFA